MIQLLIAYLIQIVSTIGVIAVGGLFIALCNRLFYANFGPRARAVCYVTGFVGTPVHELSHALFCVLFGHKITEIKMFQVSDADGTLGYVNHSYNRRNIYQRIGNFFIGVAPILVITALLSLVAWGLMPATVESMVHGVASLDLANGVGGAFGVYLGTMLLYFRAVGDYHWWIFILIGSFFALHMNLSGADIKGALSGLLLVLVAVLVADVVLLLVGTAKLNAFTQVVLTGGVFLSVFLSLALLINVALLIVSLVYRIIATAVGRR